MKKFAILLVVAAMLAILAACGQGQAPQQPAQPTPAPAPAQPAAPADPATPAPVEEEPTVEPVHLRWAVWDIAMVAYYEPLIARYAEIAPHVTIELVDLGAADFDTILLSQLIGGASYDIIKIRDVPSYASYVNNNLVMPLDGLIGATDINLANYMGIPEQFRVNGELFAVPFRSDFWVLFYNKDLFDAAGVAYPTNEMTLDAWAQLVRDVTHGTGTDRVWGNHFHTWASTTTLFGILDGQHTIADGTYDFLIPIYEMVLALEDGDYVPRRTDLQAGSIHHSGTWQNSQIAMVNMGTWFISTAREAYLDLGIRWGMAAYPVPGSAHHGNTMGQVTQLAIPRTANHPEEAMQFMAFVAGPEGAEIMASVGQFPAFMTDTALDTILASPGFPQDETTRGAMMPRNIFLEMPMHEQASEINAIRNEAHQEIMDRTMTIEAGIEMMNQRIGRELLGQ